MKWFWSVLFFFVVGASGVSAHASEGGERERAFMKALDFFDKAKSADEFRSAAVAFEALLAPEFRTTRCILISATLG